MNVLYSTGCPKCNILKKMLEQSGIPYTENNDADEMQRLGFTQAPMFSADGDTMDFLDAIRWIKKNEVAAT